MLSRRKNTVKMRIAAKEANSAVSFE